MLGDTWHDQMDVTWHPRGVTHGMSHVVCLCEWLTLSQVSSGGKRNKGKKCEDDKWQRRKVVRSFPHFDQFGYENQKGEGGKKERKKTDRERMKGGEKKMEIFSAF